MNSITEKPWGSFEILKSGKKFLVKKIFVKPGGVLSLQSHEHRSEHWIVAEGEAEVTIDKKVINLKENENIFIPKGAIHRMANRKDRDLVIIEMWYGDNLDENDIKRYDDKGVLHKEWHHGQYMVEHFRKGSKICKRKRNTNSWSSRDRNSN